jgi:hypothetical protein
MFQKVSDPNPSISKSNLLNLQEKLNQRNYHSWAENISSYAFLHGLSHNLKHKNHAEFFKSNHQPSDREIAFNNKLSILNKLHATDDDRLEAEIDKLEIRFNSDLAHWSNQKAQSLLLWKENELKLYGLFQSTIESTIWSAVKSLSTSKEIWRQLKVETLQNETGYLATLVKSFARSKIQTGESYCSYLARVNEIVDKLKDINRDPPQSWVIMQILAQLPDEHHKVTDPLFRLKPDELTMEKLKSDFLAADSNKINKDSTNPNQKALSATTPRKCAVCNTDLPTTIPTNHKRCKACQTTWNQNKIDATKSSTTPNNQKANLILSAKEIQDDQLPEKKKTVLFL